MIQASRRLALALPALLWAGICLYLNLRVLQRPHSSETVILISFIGIAFTVSLSLAWYSLGRWFAIGLASVGAASIGLSIASIPYSLLGLYFLWFSVLLFLLDRAEKHVETGKSAERVFTEKAIEEQNKLHEKLVKRRATVQVLREKYQAHVSLKAVADDFASTLNLNELAVLIVRKTAQVVAKGDLVLMYRIDVESGQPHLIASYSAKQEIKATSKLGDIFDYWVLKHRQPLLVSDVPNDYRFDVTKIAIDPSLRTVIASPMVSEGRLIGILRVNSTRVSEFSTEELRVLSILAVLGSSALVNAVLYQKTEELAISDSVTGLYVQRYFRERLEEEHKRALISNSPFSILMCDIDHFKQCNDRFGHASGDLVLKAVSQKLREGVGDNGLVSRYGGEEFAIILPGMQKDRAAAVGESLRNTIEAIQVPTRGGELKVTISVGVASFPADTLDPEELLVMADKALYKAKRLGRNQVCSIA